MLMQRKPGGYRSPTPEQREKSRISKKDFNEWFQQFWNMSGASTRKHPAPFPLELASRLVRMFSFYRDTVLDPFVGTGTTMVAALRANRNSIGLDIDAEYCQMAAKRLRVEASNLFDNTRLIFQKSIVNNEDGSITLREERAHYSTTAF